MRKLQTCSTQGACDMGKRYVVRSGIRTIRVLTATFILSGCAYRTQIYAPAAIRAGDHEQREELFLERDSLKVQINVCCYNKSLRVSMVFTAVDPSTRFESTDFFIEANGEVFRPTAPPEVVTLRRRSGVHAPLAITQDEWLEVEFGKGAALFDSFRLHIPPIMVDGRVVPDIDALTVTRTKIWKAISPM